MRFGNCSDCKKYKYLEKNGRCPSCVRENEDWSVIYYVSFNKPKVIEEGMSKEKAKKYAKGDSKMAAKPQSLIDKSEVRT